MWSFISNFSVPGRCIVPAPLVKPLPCWNRRSREIPTMLRLGRCWRRPTQSLRCLTGTFGRVRPRRCAMSCNPRSTKRRWPPREAIRLDPRHAGGYVALGYIQTEHKLGGRRRSLSPSAGARSRRSGGSELLRADARVSWSPQASVEHEGTTADAGTLCANLQYFARRYHAAKRTEYCRNRAS